MEGRAMNADDTLAANEAIWSHFLRSQDRSWLDPLGLLGRPSVSLEILDANAGRIAGLLSAIAAGPFARLYDEKAAPASGEGAAGLPTYP
jgi:hypothetical protein